MPWGVANYNVNPALNVSINGVDIAELCSAAGYNDAIRQIMADIATWIASNGVTYPISLANGGSGQTNAAAALAAFGGLGVAYQRLPQVTKSAAFAYDLTMDGGHVRYTGAAAAATINPNATTAFPVGAVILTINDGSGVMTLTRGGSVALIWAASGADANRSLAIGGMAMQVQVAIDRWFISGAGIT